MIHQQAHALVGKSHFKHIQVRTATIIKEDGVEISRSFSRHVVAPDSDSTNESADVKAMVAQFHTDAVKKAYADHVAEGI